MSTHRIAVLPGDGIGKEVMPEGLRALDAAARRFGIALQLDHFDFACVEHWQKHGDYLPPDHRYFDLSAEELLDEFAPHLVKFNPAFRREWVTGAWVHRAKYAQPVPPAGYLAMIPDLRTPLPGLYFASMSQVYPWDRGTNYAVELGRKVAALMAGDAES